MARKPQGNDRAQATAVAAREGDLAIMNTYYLGKMINSDNPAEVEVAENVGIHFPDGENGTHINVSGAGVVKNAPNKDNAVKLLEYLSSCLLYTSDAADDLTRVDLGGRRII